MGEGDIVGRLRFLGPIVSKIYRNVAVAAQNLGSPQPESSGVSDVERAMDEAADLITTLRARLELTGDFADGPDGIECRDDTIKLLDEKITTLRAELAGARKAALEEVERHLSAVQYDPAPYTAMKARLAKLQEG